MSGDSVMAKQPVFYFLCHTPGACNTLTQLLQSITLEVGIHSLASRNIFLAYDSFDLTENDHHAVDIITF